MYRSERITREMFRNLADRVTGGTFSLDGKALPTDGYFVGGAVPSLVNPTREQVEEFIASAPSDYVGFWEDSETLALYIDAVDHVPSRAYARRLAALRSEIAFWDIGANDEIRTADPDATPDRSVLTYSTATA